MGVLTKTGHEKLAELAAEHGDEWVKDLVVTGLMDGKIVWKIAHDLGMPYICLWMWIEEHCLAEYEAALRARADQKAHEALEIADDGSNDTYTDAEGNVRVDTDVVSRSKLRVETRLRLAAKWDRKRYGDAKESGSRGITVVVQREAVLLDDGHGGVLEIPLHEQKGTPVTGGVTYEQENDHG